MWLFKKKYKKEDLHVIYLYEYDKSKRCFVMSAIKIAHKKELKNKTFNSCYKVTCLDGSTFNMYQSQLGYSALSSLPLLQVIEINADRKKFTLTDIINIQSFLNKSLHEEIKTSSVYLKDNDNTSEIEAKDLF